MDLSPLAIDGAAEAERIETTLARQVRGELRRKGLVVGLSGGIDSSVVAALAVRALGAERVFGLFMPDRDSEGESTSLGRLLADHLGIEAVLEDVTPALEALGCYRRQAEAARAIFPELDEGYQFKLVLPSILDSGRISVSHLTIRSPSGETKTARMTAESYRQLVAATNFKQRVRKTMEYYHADRLGYAVAGTPNRQEFDQGFFVKQGDGAADVKPIAHLYKTQVYALAEVLGIPKAIRVRPPTTDTFSLAQTQEEFYFSLPYDRMDICLFAFNHGWPAARTAEAADLSVEQVERVYGDIVSKRRTTRYQHLPPQLVEAIEEV
ncbi:MAG: NAD(+) synthase [Polyangiaceae bacterium]